MADTKITDLSATSLLVAAAEFAAEYSADNEKWTAAQIGGLTRRTISGADTLIASDRGKVVEVTSGTFTLALTAAATLANAWWCIVYNAGTGTVTLDPNGAELIDGAATLALGAGVTRFVYCVGGTSFRTVPLGMVTAGGELTGSYPNPTVVASHSGSAHHAEAHGASVHTARTRTIRLRADAFTPRAGAPTLAVRGTNTRYRAWDFDAAVTESLITDFVMPADYVSSVVIIYLHWTNLGPGEGNAVWNVSLRDVPDVTDLNATAFDVSTTNTITAPAQDVLKISTHTVSFTPNAAPQLIHLSVARVGGDAADTLGNDAGLLGIEIDYTADM